MRNVKSIRAMRIVLLLVVCQLAIQVTMADEVKSEEQLRVDLKGKTLVTLEGFLEQGLRGQSHIVLYPSVSGENDDGSLSIGEPPEQPVSIVVAQEKNETTLAFLNRLEASGLIKVDRPNDVLRVRVVQGLNIRIHVAITKPGSPSPNK